MGKCNLAYLKSITPGSDAFVIQIIELFLNEIPDTISQILKSHDENNLVELYNNVHKIKPSVEMLGFPNDMKEALLNINVLSKSNSNPDKLKELVVFFTEYIQPILKELEDELATLKQA